ncbi:MAG: hypothetical protein V4717_12970 [Bacteroidota bacterium]
MYSSEPKTAPPLSLWIALAFVVVLMIPVVHKSAIIITAKEFEKKAIYVQQRIQAAGTRPIIAFVGTSLTAYGMDASDSIEIDIERITGIRPVVVKIWRRSTTLETMVNAMPVIEKMHPDILVVEGNMLITGSIKTNTTRKFRNALSNVARFPFVNNEYLPDYISMRDVKRKAEKVTLARYRAGIADTSELTSFKQLAMRLQQAGTRILLVDFPLENTMELRKWTAKNAGLINRNIEYITKDVAAKHYSPFVDWDSTHFVDGGHMNKQGRRAFSDWLCLELSNEMGHK